MNKAKDLPVDHKTLEQMKRDTNHTTTKIIMINKTKKSLINLYHILKKIYYHIPK